MLTFFRAFAKSWFAKILLSLVMVSFLFFGARNFPSQISNDVVTAGARRVSPADFKQMFDNYKQQLEQQNGGQPITPQDAVAHGVDKRVLQEAAGDESLLEFMHRAGVRPSDTLIVAAISQEHAFFDSVTGRFDAKTYHDKLATAQLTVAQYEGHLRDQIAERHLASGLAAGLKAPFTYGALIAGYELEDRGVSFFTLDPRNVAPLEKPTDAQLTAFMQQYSARLMQPEMRALTVVRFSAKALAPSMPVDEAAVQKLYNFRKDSASAPEKRSLIEIPAKDAATSTQMVQRLKSGQPAAAVAKAAGVQPIVYTDTVKSAVADPKVADAAFALKAGEVSDPIKSGLSSGYAVVQVQSVTPAKTADFAAMRPALEAQAKTDAAGQKVYDMVQKFEDSHGGGASIADAAKAAGVVPQSLEPVTAQGATPMGQPIAGLTPKLLKQAFSLSAGGDSEVVDDGAGEYFLVHVDKILPPALPSLQDPKIKDVVMRAYGLQEIVKRLQAKADALVQRLHKGESLDAVAASAGVPVSHVATITRSGMAKNQSLGPELLQKMFAAKAGEVVTGRMAQVAIMVAKIDAIHPAAPVIAAPIAVAQSQQLPEQMFQGLFDAARSSARTTIKPQIHPDRALQALGVSSDDAPATAGTAKAPGKAP